MFQSFGHWKPLFKDDRLQASRVESPVTPNSLLRKPGPENEGESACDESVITSDDSRINGSAKGF